jgi:hypothetical protein
LPMKIPVLGKSGPKLVMAGRVCACVEFGPATAAIAAKVTAITPQILGISVLPDRLDFAAP